MPNLNMNGPFDLDEPTIARMVTLKSPGNFALGYTREKQFVVRYIGRADADLPAELKQRIGEYTSFKFSYLAEAKAAFDKQCRNFHDFGGTERLDNPGHPERPAGSNWVCPHCEHFGK